LWTSISKFIMKNGCTYCCLIITAFVENEFHTWINQTIHSGSMLLCITSTMLDLQALHHPHENEKRIWCNLNLTQWHKFVFKLSWSQHNLIFIFILKISTFLQRILLALKLPMYYNIWKENISFLDKYQAIICQILPNTNNPFW
jgi:hypothetical protein